MKTFKATFLVLCIVSIVTMTVYAQTRPGSARVRTKTLPKAWEIIQRTDLAR